jgi:hypothetical protein
VITIIAIVPQPIELSRRKCHLCIFANKFIVHTE